MSNQNYKPKTLEELNTLAKSFGFGSAHNAITCADTYCKSYSEYLHKSQDMEQLIISIKGILSKGMNDLIDEKLKESGITLG